MVVLRVRRRDSGRLLTYAIRMRADACSRTECHARSMPSSADSTTVLRHRDRCGRPSSRVSPLCSPRAGIVLCYVLHTSASVGSGLHADSRRLQEPTCVRVAASGRRHQGQVRLPGPRLTTRSAARNHATACRLGEQLLATSSTSAAVERRGRFGSGPMSQIDAARAPAAPGRRRGRAPEPRAGPGRWAAAAIGAAPPQHAGAADSLTPLRSRQPCR